MGARLIAVSAVLRCALAPCSTADERPANHPKPRVRTKRGWTHLRQRPAVLTRAARSAAVATQFRRIGSSADE